ncbi:MAG: protein kinase [Planctomycetes bacterium]|nr:protein kinase [Planctomycetota bacterium]
MDAERWDRVRRLFDEALDQPTGARAAWLAGRCDGEVATEVRTLLAAHERADTSVVDRIPTQIGNYRDLSLLGEGGFGTVYLATQHQPVHRRVALKVLRAGMDSAQVIARFALEREALARMSHPSIAAIYDAGTTAGGMPFFAMEYVDGQSLTSYCDSHRLELMARLRLFVQVCRGVHHAHQKGVIHRDLKPSNVLVATVDGVPVPKIIDFGIAKALADGREAAAATADVRVLGTPGYLSPEQAALESGHVDARSDVYALGILLYELLTGHLPHDPAENKERGLLAYLQRVREAEPRRPSTAAATSGIAVAAARGVGARTLRRRLRGDLDKITLMALEREPARRYPSADALAADLERHLRHEPVLAGAPGVGYRLRKFVRRHRVVAASSVAILLALVFGLVAALWQNGIARSALRAAVGHRLSAQAINLAEESPTLALLLAIEGAERAPGEDADAALYTALGRHHEVDQKPVHDGAPQWSAVSDDGRCRLSGDDSQLVLCHDLSAGAIRHRFDLHEHRLTGVAVDRTGRRGASFDRDGVLFLLDLERGIALARVVHPMAVAAAAFVPAQDALLTACADGVLRRCEPDGTCVELVRHRRPLAALGMAPDGHGVAVLGDDGLLSVHALPGGSETLSRRLVAPTRKFERPVRAEVRFASAARLLVCLGTAGQLEIVDLAEPSRSWRPASQPCLAFALAEQASLLAVCETNPVSDAVVFVLDLATRARTELPAPQKQMEHLAMDPAGYTLVGAVYNEPLLRVFDPVLGLDLATVRGSNHALYGPWVTADGEWIDALGHNGSVHRWRTAVLGEQRRLALQRLRGGLLGCVPMPPGERAICWRRVDGDVRYALVDVVRGTELLPLGDSGERPPGAVLAPRHDAVILAVANGTEVVGLPDGKSLFSCPQPLFRPRCNAGLTHLVGQVDGRVQAFDMRTRALVFDRVAEGVQYADVSQDGAMVLTADGGKNTTTIWSVTSEQPVAVIEHRGFAFDACFLPDGRQVFAFANDATARVVDVATGRDVLRLDAPTADFGWVHVDPTGRHLAIRTPEEISVYERATVARRLRQAIDDPVEHFEDVAFAADGSQVLVVQSGGRYRVLPLEPLATARRLAPRELTAAERRRYDLPVGSDAPPANITSKSLVDAVIARMTRPEVTADQVAEALAQLAVAATIRQRPQPRFHLARALTWSRHLGLGGTLADADREQVFSGVRAFLAAEGEAARRVLSTHHALAGLRQQPGFAELLTRQD